MFDSDVPTSATRQLSVSLPQQHFPILYIVGRDACDPTIKKEVTVAFSIAIREHVKCKIIIFLAVFSGTRLT